jgi:hypothetical protein
MARAGRPGLLDRLRQRRVGRHAVGDRLDGRLGIDHDHARLDQIGDVWAHHDQAEQLAVARLVDRLDPPRLLHHRPRVRDPRARADGVVTVLLAGLRLEVGRRPRHGAVVDHGVVAARVLRDLACGRPCARAASSAQSPTA